MAGKRETAQYSTAELIQARQVLAASMHRDKARENVVNSHNHKHAHYAQQGRDYDLQTTAIR